MKGFGANNKQLFFYMRWGLLRYLSFSVFHHCGNTILQNISRSLFCSCLYKCDIYLNRWQQFQSNVYWTWPVWTLFLCILRECRVLKIFWLYSPDNWVHIHEGRYMQYIRMQNKQMIICENISGSAGDPHWRFASSHASTTLSSPQECGAAWSHRRTGFAMMVLYLIIECWGILVFPEFLEIPLLGTICQVNLV